MKAFLIVNNVFLSYAPRWISIESIIMSIRRVVLFLNSPPLSFPLKVLTSHFPFSTRTITTRIAVLLIKCIKIQLLAAQVIPKRASVS